MSMDNLTYKKHNKRIVLNTSVLYIRLILSVLIGLYASRLLLQALGADDYGLYNVVGGLVVMMNLLGTSMIATSYRYIAVELGKGETANPNKVYNTLFVIHVVMALILLLLGETLGVYYINHYLNIDVLKIDDALFVLHVSMFTSAINVITVPAQGLIVAREKFIYTSLLEIICAFIRLLLLLWLVDYLGNRIRCYAVIMAVYSIILNIGYNAYCWFKELDIIKWRFNNCFTDYKEVFQFSIWMFIGALACVGKNQGTAIILNLFFGTLINASFGIASQINEYANMFVKNLTQATNPQIMKSSSEGNDERSLSLVYSISRFSFLIMLLPVAPLMMNIDFILKVWLNEPPLFTNILVIYLLINGLISCLNSGFDAKIQATGKVKANQIGYTLINFSLFPLMWIAYKFHSPVYICTFIMILLSIITILFQCVIMRQLTDFKYSVFFSKTILPALKTSFMAFFPLIFIANLITMDTVIIQLLFFIICLIWTIISIYYVGLMKNERELINQSCIKYFKV